MAVEPSKANVLRKFIMFLSCWNFCINMDIWQKHLTSRSTLSTNMVIVSADGVGYVMRLLNMWLTVERMTDWSSMWRKHCKKWILKNYTKLSYVLTSFCPELRYKNDTTSKTKRLGNKRRKTKWKMLGGKKIGITYWGNQLSTAVRSWTVTLFDPDL